MQGMETTAKPWEGGAEQVPVKHYSTNRVRDSPNVFVKGEKIA